MATKIQAIEVPTKGTGKYLDVLVLNFAPFSTSVSLYWSIKSESSSIVEEVFSAGATLLEGNLTVPAEVVSVWGTDDSVIVNYVMEELSLTADLSA